MIATSTAACRTIVEVPPEARVRGLIPADRRKPQARGDALGARNGPALAIPPVTANTLSRFALQPYANRMMVKEGTHIAKLSLLGNYMATSFVAAADGHGGTLITEPAQTANQLVPLTTPHTG
jgi:hypothetical protein